MVMRHLFRALCTSVVILLASSGLPAAGRQSGAPGQPPQPPASGGQPPATATPAPAQPPQGQRPPVIRSGINFVSVDVIVSDKKTGDVVLDLKADDFEVREDKKPQRVDTFETIRIDPNNLPPSTTGEIRNDYDEE